MHVREFITVPRLLEKTWDGQTLVAIIEFRSLQSFL